MRRILVTIFFLLLYCILVDIKIYDVKSIVVGIGLTSVKMCIDKIYEIHEMNKRIDELNRINEVINKAIERAKKRDE